MNVTHSYFWFCFCFCSFTSPCWALENPPPRPLVSSTGLSLSHCPSGLGISMTTRISATVESGCHSGSMFCSILWILVSAWRKTTSINERGDLCSFSCVSHTHKEHCVCGDVSKVQPLISLKRWTNEVKILSCYINVSHFNTKDLRNRRYKM